MKITDDRRPKLVNVRSLQARSWFIYGGHLCLYLGYCSPYLPDKTCICFPSSSQIVEIFTFTEEEYLTGQVEPVTVELHMKE
jgi:hypothetical protein